jgi:hypothetical protein
MDFNFAGSISDSTLGVLSGVKYQELVMPICLSFWSMILFASLAGIELSDAVTACTFVTFATVSAAIIVLAIPGPLTSSEDPARIASVLFGAGAVALARWLFAYRRRAQKLRLDLAVKRRLANGK